MKHKGSETRQQHHFCNKVFAVRYRLAIGLFVICIFGLVADNWFTKTYSIRPLSDVGIADSDKVIHLSFFASGSERLDYHITPQNITDLEEDTCKVPRFDTNSVPSPIVTCKRPKPRPDSCRVAQKVFFSTPMPNCAHQEIHNICEIRINGGNRRVFCSQQLCKHPIMLGEISSDDGTLKWTELPSIFHLQKSILDQIKSTPIKPNYGFCFVTCWINNNTIARQLLLLPQNIHEGGDVKYTNATNINIIWLDSTSHSHFFRSMPQTVKQLQDIRDNHEAHVFNYNLMQSLAGGTYVNTVAFTSGTIKTRGFLLKHQSSIGDMFKIFKNDGYHTMWIDDLCWTWSVKKCACGIPKLLGVKDLKNNSKTYSTLKKALETKGIDQIDISLSNCEILEANKITDPFKHVKNVAICYNGFYQTHYIMSSLELMQRQLDDINKPFFHYVDLNLGHESSGRRIQTLDESLAKYVKYLTSLDNTITLMFGDHGNKYGTFVKKQKSPKLRWHILYSSSLLRRI
ncbi:uncharacterized protein [Amphiura filiformis]|uniref:uncharacterized protein n=1 Tax=Amphiura filiformis TaxID=82378 RepID=UPI003B216A94